LKYSTLKGRISGEEVIGWRIKSYKKNAKRAELGG